MSVRATVCCRLEAQGFCGLDDARIPNSGPQRHFVFGVATVWLVATGWAFYVGADIAGFALGVPLILVAALASTTHFCIPSLIYNTVVNRAGRRHQESAQ
jgi:Domain of unknown function (DUF4395)